MNHIRRGAIHPSVPSTHIEWMNIDEVKPYDGMLIVAVDKNNHACIGRYDASNGLCYMQSEYESSACQAHKWFMINLPEGNDK